MQNNDRRQPLHGVKIHTDSSYAYNCLTNWIFTWLENGFTTANDQQVVNRDLVRRAWNLHCQVEKTANFEYIRVPPESNTHADRQCNVALDQQEQQMGRFGYNPDSDYSNRHWSATTQIEVAVYF